MELDHQAQCSKASTILVLSVMVVPDVDVNTHEGQHAVPLLAVTV
jgi:hypothetical protein